MLEVKSKQKMLKTFCRSGGVSGQCGIKSQFHFMKVSLFPKRHLRFSFGSWVPT